MTLTEVENEVDEIGYIEYAHRVGPWTPSSEYLTDMTGDNLLELNILSAFYGFLDMVSYERAEAKLADFIKGEYEDESY